MTNAVKCAFWAGEAGWQTLSRWAINPQGFAPGLVEVLIEGLRDAEGLIRLPCTF